MRLVVSLFLLLHPMSLFALDAVVVKGLFKDIAIVSIDGKRRVLKAGKTSPEGAKLIMANSKEAVIEVEGQRKTYRLGDHISNSFKAPPAKSSVAIAPDKMGMYWTSGRINGFSIKFLVDTGATLIAMSQPHAKRLGLDYKMSGVEGQASTASGIARSWYIQLKKVKVGSLLLRDVDAVVIQGNHPENVLLGNSFLNRFKMVRNGQIMNLHTK